MYQSFYFRCIISDIMKNKLLFILPVMMLTACHIEGYHYDNASKYSEFNGSITFQEGVTINTLNVGWLSGEVIISEGETFTVTEVNLNEKVEYLPLYYYIDGSTVNLQYCKNGMSSNKTKNNKKKLEVTIPSSVDYIDLNLVSAVYTVNVSDMKDMRFDVVSGSGSVVVNKVETVNLNSVSGNFNLKIKDTSDLKTIDLDLVSGNVNLMVDGVKGYELKFDTVSGNVVKDFATPSDETLPKFKINFDSVSGALYIGKLEQN